MQKSAWLAGVLLLGACAAPGSTGATSAPPSATRAAPLSATASPPISDQDNPSTWTATPITPANVDKALAALDTIVKRNMATTKIPGMSVAVVRDGKTVYAKGFGVREVGKTDKVDADTVFQVASVSKPIGASVVASVVGTGEVAWTDPVSKYSKNFALADPYVTSHATIGDFYAMRAGIPHQAGDDLEQLGYSRAQIIERMRLLPLEPFRAQGLYTNFGLTIGAQAVADATHTPWNLLSEQRIYRPLGMSHTTSSYLKLIAEPNRAILHVPAAGGGWTANGNNDEHAQSPAGMVSTTANDMAKWMTMELGNGTYQGRVIVDAAALQESRVPRIVSSDAVGPSDRPASYGYGIGVSVDGTGRVRYAFSGAFSAGAATNFSLVPSAGLGISVFTNASPLGAAEAVTAEFLDIAETGTVTRDWPESMGKLLAGVLAGDAPSALPSGLPSASPVPPELRLGQYAGTYSNAYYGPVRITVSGDGLLAKLGPRQIPVVLRPFDGNTFSGEPSGAAAEPAAQFQVVNGKARSVSVVGLDAPGQQVLVRQ